MRIQRIVLQNVANKKIIAHNLTNHEVSQNGFGTQNSQQKFITWHFIIQLIQSYQPLEDLNKILIQIKRQNIWQYLTIKTSENILYPTEQTIYIRYKIYNTPKITENQKQQIQQKLKNCERKFNEYKKRFGMRVIDVNLYWASPILNLNLNYFHVDPKQRHKIQNKVIDWNIGFNYIKQIGQTLKNSKKKAFLTNNLFNQKSFQGRNQYSIVYILCHTELELQNKKQVKQREFYLAGQKINGQINEIKPKDLHKMLQNKKIQLLILHVSYHYQHFKQLMNCQNIQNILLIKSNPIYGSKSTSMYLRTFFNQLLNGSSIQESHLNSLKQVKVNYQNDETCCCCYHQKHIQQCEFEKKRQKINFFGRHYRLHQMSKQKYCCCFNKNSEINEDYSEHHHITRKFQLHKKNSKQRTFQFQKGQLQGDTCYLKGFTSKERLIGNKKILIELSRTFASKSFTKQKPNNFQIFNIFNKICGDKKIFVEILSSYLIKRKIFKENKIINDIKNLNILQLQSNPDVIYTIFCNTVSPPVIHKLISLSINILLVSKHDLNIRSYNQHYGSVAIQNLSKVECMDYIKSQKHLTNRMKQKVEKFFSLTWNKNFQFMYYPSNFDYDGVLQMIAQSPYDQKKQLEEYFKSIQQLLSQQDNQLFKDYILAIIIYENIAQKSLQQKFQTYIKTQNFYKKLSKKQNFDLLKFCNNSTKYLKIVYQKYFDRLQKSLIQIVITLARLTYPKSKLGYSMFQATTDQSASLISTLFKKSIQKLHQIKLNKSLQKLSQDQEFSFIFLKSAVSLSKTILSCFFLYDVFKQVNKYEVSVERMQTQIENNQMQQQQQRNENEWQKKLQNYPKSKILIYILLIINNAVIYRKKKRNADKINEIKGDEIYQVFQENKLNRRKINDNDSQGYESDDSLQIQKDFKRLQSYGLSSFSSIQNQSTQGEKQNQKKYDQADFKRSVNYLSRKGLLAILCKVRKKTNKNKIMMVCNSLALHLFLEKGYTQQNLYQISQVRVLLDQMSCMVREWGQNYLPAKYRIVYDILMCNLMIYTKCSRQKLDTYIFEKIDRNLSMISDTEQKQVQINIQDILSKQLLNTIQNICENEHIFYKLKESLKTFCSLRKKRKNKQDKQQKLITGYEQIITIWHQFKSCKTYIKLKMKKFVNFAYNYLFQLRNWLQDKKISEYSQFIYTYDMLVSLQRELNDFLKEIKGRLMIILSTHYLQQNKIQNKFIINFEQLFKRCEVNGFKNKNQLDNQQFVIDTDQGNGLLVVGMQLSRSKLEVLTKNQLCKSIIIHGNYEQDIINILATDKVNQIKQVKKGKIDKGVKQNKSDNNFRQVASKLLSLKTQHLFLCYLKHGQLNKSLNSLMQDYKSKENKQNIFKQLQIIWYNQKSIRQLEEVQQNIGQLVTSIIIGTQLIIKTKAYQGRVNDICLIIKNIPELLQISFNQAKNFNMREQNINVYAFRDHKHNPLQIVRKRQGKTVLVSVYHTEYINALYLEEIKSVLRLINIDKQPNRIQKNLNQKQKKVGIETFISNFKFYLGWTKQIINFFTFTDDQGIPSQPKQLSLSKSKRLIDQLMSQSFLSAYHSKSKMVVVIRNFKTNRENQSLKQIIRSMFFAQTINNKQRFCNRFVKIQGVQCLICMRDPDQFKDEDAGKQKQCNPKNQKQEQIIWNTTISKKDKQKGRKQKTGNH